MLNGLNVILMHDDGRSWRYRIRTGWIKVTLYTILVLFLTTAAGIFGSFFFWQKLARVSSENHHLQSRIADIQPRLDRLLVFEQMLRDDDVHQARDTRQRPTPPRGGDAGLYVGLAQPDAQPAPPSPASEGLPPAIPPAEAQETAPDQESAETPEVLETIADASLDEGLKHSPSQPMAADDLSDPDHELPQEQDQDQGPEPDETASTAPPEPETIEEPPGHLAGAENVQLSLHDDSMELRFDLHNRSDTTIAGRIAVSFIALDDQIVQAEGDQRALRFRIQFFREVHSPLHLPAGVTIEELLAMRIEVVTRTGDLLFTQTYPLADLLPGTS